MSIFAAIAVGGLALRAIGSASSRRSQQRHDKKQGELQQKQISNRIAGLETDYKGLYDQKLAFRDQQENILRQIEHIYGSKGLQMDQLDNKESSMWHQRDALDLDRAQLALQEQGLLGQKHLLNERSGIYHTMMDHTREMADAMRTETLQRLNVDLSRMQLGKQQTEDQANTQMALREIQTLRDRSAIMATTGEAGVGGSTVGRMVMEAITDGAMEQQSISSQATSLLQDLSIQATGTIMDAQTQVANFERQALQQKLQAVVAINQIATQIAGVKSSLKGVDIQRDRIDHAEKAFDYQLKDLEIKRAELKHNVGGSIADRLHQVQMIDHQIQQVHHEKSKKLKEIENMGYSKLMNQLETDYRTSGNPFLEAIFEIAPSAVSLAMQYGDFMI